MKKVIAIIVFINFSAFAKTNIQVDLDQLEKNKVNSEKNYEQYEKNYDIVSSNITASEKAIADLQGQRKQLKKNTQNIDKNKQAIVKVINTVKGYKEIEVKKLEDDLSQINKVKDVLDKLMSQKNQREVNITAYTDKIKELNEEKQAWNNQNKALGDLHSTLNSKENDAKKEKAKWVSKKNNYKKERDKWKKESSVASGVYNKYDHLAD